MKPLDALMPALGLAAAILFTSSGSYAMEAATPQVPKAGTVIVTRSSGTFYAGSVTTTVTVRSVQPGRVEYASRSEQPGYVYESAGTSSDTFALEFDGENTARGPNGSMSLTRTALAGGNPRQLFPMKVGSKASWTAQSQFFENGKQVSQSSSHRTCSVTGEERITVPAGAFDTFVIDCQTPAEQMSRQEWYASSIGIVVKSVEKDSQGNRTVTDLISIKDN